MKVKTLIIFAAFMVIAAGTGIGLYLYALSQKSTNFTVSQSTEIETVFKLITYESIPCTAYAYMDVYNMCYVVTTSLSDNPNYILIDSLDGELTDCVECQYRCSAYYDLCNAYNVSPEERPVP